MRGQFDPWPHHGRLFGGHVGHVQRVRHRAGQQIIRHLLGHLQRDVFLRLGGGGAQMRRADHVGQVEQRVVGCRLHLEHIQCSASHLTGFQRRDQGRLVDQTATGAVDDADTALGLGKVFRRQDVAGLVGQRHMQRDEIGAVQQLVQLDLGDPQSHGAFVRQKRVIGDHLHLQPDSAVADDATDIAGPDNAQGLVEQLHPHEARLFPLAGLRAGIRLGQLTRHREHHGDGMFGGGDRVAKGRVHHDHAFFGRSRNVDIIDADPGTAHDL